MGMKYGRQLQMVAAFVRGNATQAGFMTRIPEKIAHTQTGKRKGASIVVSSLISQLRVTTQVNMSAPIAVLNVIDSTSLIIQTGILIFQRYRNRVEFVVNSLR
jgi:hypothetical protein